MMMMMMMIIIIIIIIIFNIREAHFPSTTKGADLLTHG